MNMDEKFNDHDEEFFKNIEEESVEDDVERQIDQTIAAYNKKKEKDANFFGSENTNKVKPPLKNNRVESAKPNIVVRKDSSNRIESANVEGERRKDYQTKKEMFYDRLNEYVKQNRISPEDFWNPSKDKLNADEFKECLDIIGFNYGKDEFEDVIFDITDANFNVTMAALCSKIKAWENYNSDKTLEALKDNVMKMAQESKKKLTSADSSKKNFLVRPQSGTLYASGNSLYPAVNNRPFSGISGISTHSKQTMGTTQMDYNKLGNSTDELGKTGRENKSAQFIKETKKKEAKKDQVLALTLSKAKNEFEYDCLVKMGEANEISQSLGETVTYRAYKSACHVYDYDQLVSELTTKEFIREYKMLKQRYQQKQNLKIWEVLNQQKTANTNFYFSSAKTMAGEAGTEGTEEKGKTIAKKDRQKELKAVLFETMKLTNTLKSQLDKLEKSGLVYDANPPKY